MQDTLITLSDTAAIHIGEQRRPAMRERGEQVVWLAQFEPQLRRGRISTHNNFSSTQLESAGAGRGIF